MKIVSADEALTAVQSGHRVYVHEAAMAPQSLSQALVAPRARARRAWSSCTCT
jgi:hypothetical protein